MGRIKRQPPVKLIIGFIFKEEDTLRKAKGLLSRKFGKIDYESAILDFSHTDYYAREFGAPLKRQFISFTELILPENLPRIKITTNRIEQKLSRQGLRVINIDPGYLNLAKLILASTKDYRHRVYLNQGIYAEVTLFYQDKSFTPWEWTYPDYKTSDYIAVFNRIREIYAKQINNKLKSEIQNPKF